MPVKVEYVDEIPTIRYGNIQKSPEKLQPATVDDNCFVEWENECGSVAPDATLKWIVLVVLAIILGYAASLIDLASVVLNDFKKGFCSSSVDQWSLLAPYLTCPAGKWRLWLELLTGSSLIWGTLLISMPIYFILAGIFSVAATYATSRAPYIRLLGLPEIKVIVSGLNYNIEQYLGIRTLFYKTAGLVLVVALGFWLGKEGPLVHVACCLMNIVYDFLISRRQSGNDYLRRELLGALAAAGISVAFNAPIGGVLFMLEFLQPYWNPTKILWISFVASMIAIVVVSSFKIFTDGRNFSETELFKVEFGNFSWLFMEFIPFSILGVFGGVYGYSFNYLNNWFYKSGFRNNLKLKLCRILHLQEQKFGPVVEVLFVLLATTVLNYPLDITRLPLHVYVKTLFTACPEKKDQGSDEPSQSLQYLCQTSPSLSIVKLLFVFLQGFFLLAYSFGLALPGGLLMPSLALGASIGRALGVFLQVLQNSLGWKLAECTVNSCLVSPSSYAVVGAASFMTGVTKLTMCVVILIFELTGAVTYVLPIMISVMVLKFVNDYLSHRNIYDEWLMNEFNQTEDSLKLNSGKGSGICDYTTSTQIVRSKLPLVPVLRILLPLDSIKLIEISKTYQLDDLWLLLNLDNHQGYPLISTLENPVLLGYIHKPKLMDAIESCTNVPSDSNTNTLRLILIMFELDQDQSVPHSVISDQLRALQLMTQDAVKCVLNTKKPTINLTKDTPLLTVLELFEKMHLNWLIVTEPLENSEQKMVGFVDRYMLAALIDLEFDELRHELPGPYDLEEVGSLFERDRDSLDFD